MGQVDDQLAVEEDNPEVARGQNNRIDKELLGLLFDNDILFELSQNMCRAVLKYDWFIHLRVVSS